MSDSSSAYEPEQDDELSDHDIRDILIPDYRSSSFEPSSPALEELNLGSTPASSSTALSQRRRTKVSGESGPKTRSNALRNARLLPVDRYLELFNEYVNDTLNLASYDQAHHTTRSSQHGAVTWSAKEKNIFFDILAKKGKDGIREIAGVVGTKSAMEVQDYIKLLHSSLELHHRNDKYPKPVRFSDIPAASEVDESCCQYLDRLAEAATLRDEQSHNTAGKRRHQDFWLVNNEVAALVDEKTDSTEQDEPLEHEIFATAGLFNLSNWIELSENIFMNSGQEKAEDNWKNVSFDGETPAMTCEAFSDFYTLAVSITRRLVQSSIFFALSRIRSLKSGGWDVTEWVRKEDVQTALDVLKLKPNSREFWKGAARRCTLDVRSTVNPVNRQIGLISYDEVEERLSRKNSSLPSSRATSVCPASEDGSPSDSDLVSDSELNETGPGDDDSSAVDSEDLSDPEETYASKLDNKASRQEESRIWEHLKFSVTADVSETNPDPADPGVKMETDDEAPSQKPLAKRKTRDELVDWRDRTIYRSEWESLKGQEEFEEHVRKRQKVDGGLV